MRNSDTHPCELAISRREMLRCAGMGFGSLALAHLLCGQGQLEAADATSLDTVPFNPLAPRPADFCEGQARDRPVD